LHRMTFARGVILNEVMNLDRDVPAIVLGIRPAPNYKLQLVL